MPIEVAEPGARRDYALGAFGRCTLGRDGLARCETGEHIELGHVSRVVVGRHHACALLENGESWCWGANESNQVGDSLPGIVERPVRAAHDLSDVDDIAIGGAFTCALSRSRGVRCWGDRRIEDLGPALRVAAGDDHACALLASQKIRCWNGSHAAPVDVLAPLDFVQLVAAGSRTCARTNSGGVYCWGAIDECDASGCRLVAKTTPVALPGTNDAVDLALSPSHGCLRTRANVVACWGRNSYHKVSASLRLAFDHLPRVAVSPSHAGPGCNADPAEIQQDATDRPFAVVR